MRILFWLIVFFPFFTQAQNNAEIHFNLKNAKADQLHLLNSDYTNPAILFGEREERVPLNEGKAVWESQISKPVFISFAYFESKTKYYMYKLYLSPGDSLQVAFDVDHPDSTIVVKGRGQRHSQPLFQELFAGRDRLKVFEKDSLPYDVLNTIKLQSIENKQILKDYIKKYNPGKTFVDVNTLYLEYYPIWTYLFFKGNQSYHVGAAYERNENKWQAIEDSLRIQIPRDNPELFAVPDYVYFLPVHISRIKEYVWNHKDLLPYYYDTDSQEEALQLFEKDHENLLMEKIIDKHFEGKTAEFLYATLFKGAINQKEDNLPEIFSRFVKKYPNSAYTPYIEPAIREVEEKRTRKLNDNMLLVENPDTFKTFDDVLKSVKGKTVLLDMWGTWCGPCRTELSVNSEAIKKHFKDSDLEYLYIANYDLGKEEAWKQLIAYYNLEGTHIMASHQLTTDIMEQLGTSGYPTYAIIKKDGTFELSKAGYPMNRKILIDQLESALK